MSRPERAERMEGRLEQAAAEARLEEFRIKRTRRAVVKTARRETLAQQDGMR